MKADRHPLAGHKVSHLRLSKVKGAALSFRADLVFYHVSNDGRLIDDGARSWSDSVELTREELVESLADLTPEGLVKKLSGKMREIAARAGLQIAEDALVDYYTELAILLRPTDGS